MDKKDKILWTICLLFSLASMIVCSVYAVKLFSFEQTCAGCVEAGRCSPTIMTYGLKVLDQSSNNSDNYSNTNELNINYNDLEGLG